jgi:HAMP domain-containing protein
MSQSDLDARYGRTRAHATRMRVIAIAAAAGVAVVVIAWVVWVGLLGPSASLETKDVGYVSHSDASGEVRWQLTAPADTEVSCAVKAVSEKHAVVGWLVVDVPASGETTRILRATLRTSEPTVGGSVYRCWLTADGPVAGAFVGDLS